MSINGLIEEWREEGILVTPEDPGISKTAGEVAADDLERVFGGDGVYLSEGDFEYIAEEIAIAIENTDPEDAPRAYQTLLFMEMFIQSKRDGSDTVKSIRDVDDKWRDERQDL